MRDNLSGAFIAYDLGTTSQKIRIRIVASDVA